MMANCDVARAGLREVVLVTPETYGKTQRDMTGWAYELGILPPSAFVAQDDSFLAKVGRRWQRLPKEPSPDQSVLPVPQAWIEHLIREREGTLILMAEKQWSS